MKIALVSFILLTAVATAAGLYWWKRSVDLERAIRPQQPAAAVAEPAAPETVPLEMLNPVPQEQPTPEAPVKPLPALNASDEAVVDALGVAAGRQAMADLLVSDDLVRRFVATIDNLPRKKVAERLVPLRRPVGQTVTNGEGAFVSLSPNNYVRYTRYARFAQSTDAKQLVAAYTHFYPLLQQAYAELGYPKKYFNDRVIEVIDDLLAAPEVKDPIDLLRPKVLYEFADPRLEELSAGQKIMIRMGPDNAAAIKSKLSEIRGQLATHPPAKSRSQAAQQAR